MSNVNRRCLYWCMSELNLQQRAHGAQYDNWNVAWRLSASYLWETSCNCHSVKDRTRTGFGTCLSSPSVPDTTASMYLSLQPGVTGVSCKHILQMSWIKKLPLQLRRKMFLSQEHSGSRKSAPSRNSITSLLRDRRLYLVSSAALVRLCLPSTSVQIGWRPATIPIYTGDFTYLPKWKMDFNQCLLMVQLRGGRFIPLFFPLQLIFLCYDSIYLYCL